MANILTVPVQLDALFVEIERVVAEAKADFTKLPHTANGHDVHPNNPYISEEIISKPFDDKQLRLAAGIHLHWSLPDTLTKRWAETDDDTAEPVFPQVPNRWYIKRSSTSQSIPDKEWLVQSDYLWPIGQGKGNTCIPNPKIQQEGEENYIPYRFLGRSLPYENYINSQDIYDSKLSYKNLTVLGYGEPTFTAFYPNCHSVFGFHDSEITPNDITSGLQYELIGWYNEEKNDFLKTQVGLFSKQFGKENKSTAGVTLKPTEDQLMSFVRKTLKWNIPADCTITPREMLCYSKLVFNPDGIPEIMNSTLKNKPVTVAVGMTAMEAMSAYLANKLAAKDDTENKGKRLIEEQMEALLMDSKNGKKIDLGAHFLQNRHEKGFHAIDGGSYWIIQKKGDQIIKDESADTIWNSAREKLVEVNDLQQLIDSKNIELQSKKEQLYADWYKYMVCAYPAEKSWDSLLDVDDVKYFIEAAGLNPLKEQINYLDHVLLPRLKNKLEALQVLLNSLNTLLAKQADILNQEKKEKQIIIAPIFSLAEKPRPRFWKPNDPVIFAESIAMQASKRFGKDGSMDPGGLLPSKILADTITKLVTSKDFGAVLNLITDTTDDPAYHSWTDQPWNPLMLEWKTTVFPVANESNNSPNSMGYESSFITNNFLLKENDPNVSYQAKGQSFNSSASIFSGSSILTTHASKLMRIRMEEYIEKNVLKECLVNKNQQGYFADTNTTEIKSFDTSAHLNLIIKWYDNIVTAWYDPNTTLTPDQIKTLKEKDLTHNTLSAYQKISSKDFHALSQSLGGFNESLLMSKESLELKVKDPLAFKEYAEFSKAVAAVVEKRPLHIQYEKNTDRAKSTFTLAEDVNRASLRAPLPQNDFNPLRAGKLELTGLRVVDTFGQAVNLDISKGMITSEYFENTTSNENKCLITSEHLSVGDSNQVLLRPRLLQAAQVNFRWLSSQVENTESNELAHYGPICGWVMTNNLDNSLMVFEASGKAIGAFTASGSDRWETAPGSPDLPFWESGENGIRVLYKETDITNASVSIVIETSSTVNTPITFTQNGAALTIHLPKENPIGELPCLASPDLIREAWLAWKTNHSKTPFELVRIGEHNDIINETTVPGIFTQPLDFDVNNWADSPPNGFNAHLYKMMLYLKARTDEGLGFMKLFRETINAALDNIHPDTYAQHHSMAQLMGRPLALVRASLDMLLKAPPAIHQGWDTFAMDMHRRSRETNNFTKVKLPIRIGEHNQLNDGVVGYWVEKNGGYSNDRFYSPSSDKGDSVSANNPSLNYITTHMSINSKEVPVNQFQSIDDGPMALSILMDPRGKVNLTTGILPAKTIDIPPKLYKEAMDRMEVFFVSSPHLVDSEGLHFKMPAEKDFAWSFIYKNNQGEWLEDKLQPKKASEKHFTGEKKIREGWLKIKHKND
ncbi:MAG: hypothetical protein JKY48_15780 [Flavobacteriales bacterium]|nr:hypothetical protein [Flavobacteriales bacterium]